MATAMFRTLSTSRAVIQRLFDHVRATNIGKRTLLSEAYYGNEVWQKRKRLAMDMVELQLKLDRDFLDFKKPVPSIELHIFVDNIMTTAHLQTAEEYLYSHRHSSVARHLRKATIHAWFRACLRLNEPERALRTLSDKTNYGLFPDMIMFNILIDTFLKNEDYTNAAVVAMEMMHTEVLDETTPLAQHLALYTCLKYLTSDTEIEDDKLQNLGWTLADATRDQTSLLARSYHVIGYSMISDKLNSSVRALERIADLAENECILQEAISKLESAIENSEDREKLQDQFQNAVKKLRENNSIVDKPVDDLIQSLVEKLTSLEADDIEQYPTMLLDWHQSNVHAVQRQRDAKEAYVRSLKEAKLEKLLQATGGVQYWLDKREQEAKGIQEEKESFEDVEFIDKEELAKEVEIR
ncbi:28S ribosomal protein S27, mitochondrial-like [Anneissia japonica]|uniref:28S ribosomal protein S27, mitochondrial-like n=1 Tax=Anneissia japonica TaxID=1529436 RepID=UPI00142566BC|nr:28S ribosomal protein S27, mitochondrial-like [Anneissia japonica]